LAWTSFRRATRSSRRPPERQGCRSVCLPFELPQPALRRKFSSSAPSSRRRDSIRSPNARRRQCSSTI
jgi:hypothetical protein